MRLSLYYSATWLPSTVITSVLILLTPEVKVLDEPYSAKPAQLGSHTGAARLHSIDTAPAYVDWRASTATPLSGIS